MAFHQYQEHLAGATCARCKLTRHIQPIPVTSNEKVAFTSRLVWRAPSGQTFEIEPRCETVRKMEAAR